MFGFGAWELAIILFVGLLVLGPAVIPRLGRRVSEMVVGFRKAADELQDSIQTKESAVPREGDTSRQLESGDAPEASDERPRDSQDKTDKKAS